MTHNIRRRRASDATGSLDVSAAGEVAYRSRFDRDTATVRTTSAAALRTRRALALLAAGAVTALAGCGGDEQTANGLIAFARAPADGGGLSELHLVEADGTVSRLTRGALDRAPAWSPDGRRLAFVRAEGGGQPAARLVDLDGVVSSLGEAAADEVAWAPDGDRLLVAGAGELSVVEDDGDGREVVVSGAGAVQDAAWAPDGRSIVFVGGDGGVHADLYAAEPGRAGTVRLTRLPFGAGRPYSPVWAPDGERIAFLLPRGVFVMNADGSERRSLVGVPAAVDPSSLAWSPDGDTLAYTLLRLRGAAGSEDATSGVFLVSPDGGEPRRVSEAVDVNVAWSPDGSRLVAQRFTGPGVSHIVELDPETGAERLLTAGRHSDTSPAWQPLP
jgi:Tol biopolymer transport system component